MFSACNGSGTLRGYDACPYFSVMSDAIESDDDVYYPYRLPSCLGGVVLLVIERNVKVNGDALIYPTPWHAKVLASCFKDAEDYALHFTLLHFTSHSKCDFSPIHVFEIWTQATSPDYFLSLQGI